MAAGDAHPLPACELCRPFVNMYAPAFAMHASPATVAGRYVFQHLADTAEQGFRTAHYGPPACPQRHAGDDEHEEGGDDGQADDEPDWNAVAGDIGTKQHQ